MMKRRDFLRLAGLGAAGVWGWPGGGLCAAEEKPPERPNIIFILADDLGITDISCCGGDRYQTPNIDALAKAGVRFENCFSAPLCGPSRAMCMTGRYPFRTGVVDNSTGARAHPRTEVSIAKILREAGYATAVAGKWRQLAHFHTVQDGQAWGFDEFLIWGAGRAGEGEPDKKGKGGGAAKGERYWDPDYNLNGKPMPDTKGKYGPDLLHEFVVDFIRRHKDQPFFIYYPMPLIHGPILRTPDSPPGSKDLRRDNIAYMDKLVGKLAAELDRLNLREKTLIVFTGDNGPAGIKGTLGGRPIDGHKGSLKEGGSRVPLIASWKGTAPEGVVLKDLVDFSDFYATFAELAGAKLPEGVTLDSHSFAPQLRGQKGQPREWVYIQLGARHYVRTARWKLTESGELFDMRDAPFREIPAPAGDPEAEAARKALQAVLEELGVRAAPAKPAEEPPQKRRRKNK